MPIKEEVFAEKIHAYTLPRDNENSRVKDMLDLALLIEDELDVEKAKTALVGVFAIRKTHQVPTELPLPPKSWQDLFKGIVRDATIDLTLDQASANVTSFYITLK